MVKEHPRLVTEVVAAMSQEQNRLCKEPSPATGTGILKALKHEHPQPIEANGGSGGAGNVNGGGGVGPIGPEPSAKR